MPFKGHPPNVHPGLLQKSLGPGELGPCPIGCPGRGIGEGGVQVLCHVGVIETTGVEAAASAGITAIEATVVVTPGVILRKKSYYGVKLATQLTLCFTA